MAAAGMTATRTCSAPLTPSTEEAEHDCADLLRTRVLAFIDARLEHAELNVPMLQRAFGISRTQLYGLFESSGGVGHLIRQKRLRLALRHLCEDPRCRITDLVYRCGFSSERQFQRAFRSRFGLAPSDMAAAVQAIDCF